MKKTRMENCTMALTPRRFQFGFASGSSARRAGMGLLPIFCFQASGLGPAERLCALKPTPNVVLGGGSAIIVVIRLSPHTETVPRARSQWNQVNRNQTCICQYEGTYGTGSLE